MTPLFLTTSKFGGSDAILVATTPFAMLLTNVLAVLRAELIDLRPSCGVVLTVRPLIGCAY